MERERVFTVLFLCLLCLLACEGRGRGGGGRGGGRSGSRGSSHSSSHGWSSGHSSHGSSHGTGQGSTGHGGTGGRSFLSTIFARPQQHTQVHTYPKSRGLSGTSNQGSYVSHTYYAAPQHVYISEYRHSDSRYRDILIGLALYDHARSHTHYHSNYHDTYYRRNHPTSTYSEDVAVCNLRITENKNTKVLVIPCDIVSTFTDGSTEIKPLVNCTSNITRTKISSDNFNYETIKYDYNPIQMSNSMFKDIDVKKMVHEFNFDTNANGHYESDYLPKAVKDINEMLKQLEIDLSTTTTTTEETTTAKQFKPVTIISSNRNGTATVTNTTIITQDERIMNITVCDETHERGNDPLSVKGPTVDPSKMKCTVEIKTKDAHFRNDVDCKALIKYTKLPLPKMDPVLLPSRNTLETWLNNPPWWGSALIAV